MPLTLRTTFRPGPNVQALIDGRVQSDRLKLNFIPVDPISRAFRRAIRDEEFDVSEMALVTLAMAHDLGEPWIGLPVVMLRGFHHGALQTPIDSPINTPQDLPGHAIGVRAYSQTTGVWLRGILQSEYGIRPDQMRWVTIEDAHVPGFQDPSYVSRAPEGQTLNSLLTSGQISAVIGDATTKFGLTRSVIPDSDKAAEEWYARTGVYPINHVIAFRRDLLADNPWLGAELTSMFSQCPQPHQDSINLCLQFAFEQGLTRRQYLYEDIFNQ